MKGFVRSMSEGKDEAEFLDKVEILRAIPDRAGKQAAWDVISTEYRELMLDDDAHPVVFDASGVLRFQADPLIYKLVRTDVLDLNRLAIQVARGEVPPEMQRKVAKSTGYSLAGYFDLSNVQKWAREVSGLGSDVEEEEEEEPEPELKRACTAE